MLEKEKGLGWISKDYADLFRNVEGPLANKDPVELKPPQRVRKADAKSLSVPFYPMGVLHIKIRLHGDDLSLPAVAKGEYMKWAIREALSQSVGHIAQVRAKPVEVLFCSDDLDLVDVQMPSMGEDIWQFCELRCDYRLMTKSKDVAEKVVAKVYERMTDFEADFCKCLEVLFRSIYNLTVLGLKNKAFIMMDGTQISDELQLFQAAAANRVGLVVELLGRPTDVNAYQKAARFPAGLIDDEDLRFACVTLQRTALLAAAEEGSTDALRALLDGGADVHYQDTSGFHALYLAAGAPGGEVPVRLLLEKGAYINMANKSGYTALHNACGSGADGAIRALLEAKADMNAKSRNGAAPIHTAVINSQPTALEVLKEFRANLDMPAFGGNTPVHEGVMQNNPSIIQKLFDLKADINIESGPENGFATPLKMATERKKKKAMRKLQDLGALERIEHEYEDSAEGEFEEAGPGEFVPRVRGRLTY